MTLTTWKEEFYPVPAKRRMSKRAAIEHSLRKWEGLRTKNLKRHGLVSLYEYGSIDDLDTEEDLDISSSTCALCVKYRENYFENSYDACEKCPLFNALGAPCDSLSYPYRVWRDTGNPRPMINALRNTLMNL